MSHIEKYISSYVKFVRILHIWPEKHKQPDKLMFVKAIFYNCYLVVSPFGAFLHFMKYRDKKLSVVEDLITINISAMVLCILAIYMYKLKKFYSSYEDFCKFCDKFNRHNQIIPTMDGLILYCNLAIFLGSCTYYINKYMMQYNCEEINAKKNLNVSCGFFINVWFPINIYRFPIKQVIILLQIWSAFIVFSLLSNLCILFCAGIFQVRSELRFVRNLLEELPEHASREQVRIRLYLFSKAHTIIRRFILDFNNISENIVGTYFIFASIILALVLFQGVMFQSSPPFMHLLCWMLVSWCVPAFSQYLLNECEELEKAVYNLHWYDMNLSIQKTVYIILMQTQRPIGIRAGALSYLSAAVCLRVWLKASRSYVAMMANALDWI